MCHGGKAERNHLQITIIVEIKNKNIKNESIIWDWDVNVKLQNKIFIYKVMYI